MIRITVFDICCLLTQSRSNPLY